VIVDTSAVVALLFGEPAGVSVEERLLAEKCLMSAATRVELGIVIEAKTGPPGTQLLEELLMRAGVEVVPVDGEQASVAITCWRRFGKGRHAASLNYGDTFAYALAWTLGEPLLYVGNDFAQTDIKAVVLGG